MKLLVKENSTVFMDDYDQQGVRDAIRDSNLLEIERIYTENDLKSPDWLGQSMYKTQPEPYEKKYLIVRYKKST